MAILRATQRRQVIEKLQQMAPRGEQFISCVHCMTGPSPYLDMLFDQVPFLGLVIAIMRKYYFFTVTSQHVVLNSANRFTNRPGDVLGSWPRHQFPISNVSRGALWGKFYVQFQGSNTPTRLNFDRYWRNEFDQMMAAVNQGGGTAHAIPSALPPAGWYADPSQPAGRRYWDGAKWTEHVAP